jgi:hypothetical protein
LILSIILGVYAFFSLSTCRPAAPEELPLPTEICIRTTHHGLPVKYTTVYLKSGVDTFPGYDKPASYYDASFKTGSNAKGCIAPVPTGKIWLVAFGKDTIYTPPPYDVRGSMLIEISLDKKPKIDTTLYVSEVH